MTGAAKALFLPLSLAVGFAMAASFFLSSTLVPILTVWLLKSEPGHVADRGPSRFQQGFARGLQSAMALRRAVILAYLVISGLIVGLVGTHLGAEIFPKVDAGQFQLRLHAATGSRIEHTEAVTLRALEIIKSEAGPKNVKITLAFIGVQAPSYPIDTIQPLDGRP